MEIDFNKYKEEFIKKVGSYEGWEVPVAWPIHYTRPNGGYPGNSIFFSEALTLYTLAKEYKIDCFIESGVYRGGSTSLWGRIFPNIELYSIDYVQEGPNPRQKWESVQAKLKPLYPNINFIEGDGNIKLPEIIESNSNKKFGVFVDGPKDEEGLKLAEKCANYDNVYFSSLHDYSHPYYFSTKTNLDFRKIVGDMNKVHPQIQSYPNGPGLTIIVK